MEELNKQPQEQPEVDPQTQKEIDLVQASLMQLIHSPETASSVMEELKSGPPEMTIPVIANSRMEMLKSDPNLEKEISPEAIIAGGLYAVVDLSILGNEAGIWEEPVNEQKMMEIFQDTGSKYIHKGLRDGRIDPIELQSSSELLFNDKQRQAGGMVAQEIGLPSQPTAGMGVDRIIQDTTKPLEEENQKLKGLLRQQTQQQRGTGGQGGI